jgi:hypothetical protein
VLRSSNGAYTPLSDRAELAIRELKKKTRRHLEASHCPKRLWDDCMELVADINAHTVHDSFGLYGQTPQTLLTGNTPHISILAEFHWYQWVKWFDENASFPMDREVYARYLGPSKAVGCLMTSKLLNDKDSTLHRSSFRPLTREEVDDPTEKEKRRAFDKRIIEILGGAVTPEGIREDTTPDYERHEDEENEEIRVLEQDYVGQNAIDQYLNAEVVLPIAGELLKGKVIQRKRDADGNLIGRSDSNPIFRHEKVCRRLCR